MMPSGLRLARFGAECVLEVCVLYPWALLGGGVLQLRGPVAPGWLLLAFVMAGWLGGAWVRTGQAPLTRARAALTVAGVGLAAAAALVAWAPGEATLLLRAPAAWVILLAAWWRGLSAGRELRASAELEMALRVGAAGFVVAALLLWAMGAATAPQALLDRLVPAALGLLLAGLGAMSLAAVDAVQQAGGPPIGMGWLAVVAGALLAVGGGALLAALLLPLGVLAALLRHLAPLGQALVALALVLAAPFVLLLLPLAALIRMALAALLARLPSPAQLPTEQAGDAWQAWLRALPEDLPLVVGAAAVVLSGLGLLLLLTTTLRRWSDREGAATGDERASVWRRPTLAALRAWIIACWRRRRPRLLRRVAAGLAVPPGVRGVYYIWLLHLRVTGRGRRPPETPAELRARLGLQPTEALDHLTALYERARYGETEGAEALAAARRAAEELAQAERTDEG